MYLGRNSFGYCTGLTYVYFKGNAPYVPFLSDFPVLHPFLSWADSSTVFGGAHIVAFYLDGTIGWTEAKETWLEQFSMHTWTLPADEPEVIVFQKSVQDGQLSMTLVFGGAWQSSSDLKNWETVTETSPYEVSEAVAAGGKKFYRALAIEKTE